MGLLFLFHFIGGDGNASLIRDRFFSMLMLCYALLMMDGNLIWRGGGGSLVEGFLFLEKSSKWRVVVGGGGGAKTSHDD